MIGVNKLCAYSIASSQKSQNKDFKYYHGLYKVNWFNPQFFEARYIKSDLTEEDELKEISFQKNS